MSSGILRAGKFSAGATVAKVGVAANALSEPLLSKALPRSTSFADEVGVNVVVCDADDYEEDEEEQSFYSEDILPESMSGIEVVTSTAVAILVTSGLAATASAMLAVQSAIVFVMGGICIVNSPSVAYKQLRMLKSAGVRRTINGIRTEIDLLKTEIDFLSLSTDNLQAEADVLVGLEHDLRDISKKQGTTVKEIVELVNANEDILSAMKGNLKQTFAASMAKIVIRSDCDGDMKIDLKEAPLLSLRLRIELETYGIKLDTNKFETMITEDNDIGNVIKFLGNMLLLQDDPSSDSDDESVDSELTMDFESYCNSLGGDEPDPAMTFEEKVSMVTVSDKFSKGSVEVARGNRMTLMPTNNTKEERRKTIMKEVKKRQTMLATRSSGTRPKPIRGQNFRGMDGIVE